MPAPKGNKHAVGNKGGGRPTLYKPEYAEMARKLCLMAQGVTDVDLASFFSVSEVTINAWKLEYDDFSLALKAGKLKADTEVAASLYHRAIGYSHDAVKIFMPAGANVPVYAPYTEHFPPDTAAAKLWLNNRQPEKWREAVKVEHSGVISLETLVAGSMGKASDKP